jgi:hypothetical protein
MAQINNKIPIEYFNIFYYFADNYKNINILSQRKSYAIGNIKYMIKTNLLLFLNDWDKSYDFSEFINEVENDILIFSKLLIIDNSTKEENCLKINFFFELLYDLKPELKQKLSSYQIMTIKYINNMNNSDYLGFTDENTIMNYYLMIILIYIKFKFGNYNPEILFLFFEYYQQYNKIFLLFIKSIKENNKDNKKIVNHFFIGDFAPNKKNLLYLNQKFKINMRTYYKVKSQYFLFDNIIFFFNNYLENLNEIKYSLVYDYIISILTEFGKYNKEKEYLIPYIMLNIGQNEKIINLILEKIINYEFNLFDFLKVEYDEKNENKFRKFIYLFIQTSKHINLISNYIFPLKIDNFNLFQNNYYLQKEYLISN